MVIVHELLLQQEELVVQHVLTVAVLNHNPEWLHKAVQTILHVCIDWISVHHQVVCGCDVWRLCVHSVLGAAMKHDTDRQAGRQAGRQADTDTIGNTLV